MKILYFIIFLSLSFLQGCGGSSDQNPQQDPPPLAQTYSAEYKYDSLGRLEKVKYVNGQTINYNYDENGNLTLAQVGQE